MNRLQVAFRFVRDWAWRWRYPLATLMLGFGVGVLAYDLIVLGACP